MDNKKYNPMGKEFQEKVKELGLTGYQYMRKLIDEGKIVNPREVEKKRVDEMAKRFGYKDYNEYIRKERNEYKKNWKRQHRWEKGICEPMEFNDSCSSYFGVSFGEELFRRFLLTIFDQVKKTGYIDKGIDFICKNPRHEFIDKYAQFKLERDEEYTLQLKVRNPQRVLLGNDNLHFPINYNNNPDYFILAGFDNRESMNPIHIWLIHKNDIIRGRKFWKRISFSVVNLPQYIMEFKTYELEDELKLLSKLCNQLKEEM